jgi:hypothetical protein
LSTTACIVACLAAHPDHIIRTTTLIAIDMTILFDKYKVRTLQPGVAVKASILNFALAANNCTTRSNVSEYNDYSSRTYLLHPITSLVVKQESLKPLHP